MTTGSGDSWTEEALRHLKFIKPYDGWSIDVYLTKSGERLTMLRRRNAPISDTGYRELAIDAPSGCVVGLKKSRSPGGELRGVVLVERDGSVCRDQREIPVTPGKTAEVFPTVRSFHGESTTGSVKAALEKQREDRANKRMAMEAKEEERRRQRDDRRGAAISSQPGALTDEQNRQLLQVALLVVLIAIFVRMLAAAIFGLSILLVPVLIYAAQTCPSDESFDAKKEIKRVLRGFHLPEDHPEKPKGWLEQTMARITSSVTTEAATAFGYEVTLTKFFPFATWACARVPAAKVECYWIGVFGKWWYVTMKSIQPDQVQ